MSNLTKDITGTLMAIAWIFVLAAVAWLVVPGIIQMQRDEWRDQAADKAAAESRRWCTPIPVESSPLPPVVITTTGDLEPGATSPTGTLTLGSGTWLTNPEPGAVELSGGTVRLTDVDGKSKSYVEAELTTTGHVYGSYLDTGDMHEPSPHYDPKTAAEAIKTLSGNTSLSYTGMTADWSTVYQPMNISIADGHPKPVLVIEGIGFGGGLDPTRKQRLIFARDSPSFELVFQNSGGTFTLSTSTADCNAEDFIERNKP